jgi:hypothetical protein
MVGFLHHSFRDWGSDKNHECPFNQSSVQTNTLNLSSDCQSGTKILFCFFQDYLHWQKYYHNTIEQMLWVYALGFQNLSYTNQACAGNQIATQTDD